MNNKAKYQYPPVQQIIDELASWYGFRKQWLEYDWDYNLTTQKELRRRYSIMLKAKAYRGVSW